MVKLLQRLSIHRSNDLLKSDEKISSGTCILIRPVSVGECYPDGLGNFIQLKFFKCRHEYFGKLNSIDFIPGLISYTSLFQRMLQKTIVEFDIMCSKDAYVKERGDFICNIPEFECSFQQMGFYIGKFTCERTDFRIIREKSRVLLCNLKILDKDDTQSYDTVLIFIISGCFQIYDSKSLCKHTITNFYYSSISALTTFLIFPSSYRTSRKPSSVISSARPK